MYLLLLVRQCRRSATRIAFGACTKQKEEEEEEEQGKKRGEGDGFEWLLFHSEVCEPVTRAVWKLKLLSKSLVEKQSCLHIGFASSRFVLCKRGARTPGPLRNKSLGVQNRRGFYRAHEINWIDSAM